MHLPSETETNNPVNFSHGNDAPPTFTVLFTLPTQFIFMNNYNDYTYEAYENNSKAPSPGKITDQYGKPKDVNKDSDKPTTQHNSANNSSENDDKYRTKPLSKIGGANDGVPKPYGFTSMSKIIDEEILGTDKYKYISIIAISPGGGAGGGGASYDTTKRAGTGQGGSAGIATIGEIILKDLNYYISNIELTTGGGGVGGTGGKHGGNSHSGLAGFAGGDTIIVITLNKKDNDTDTKIISITLSGGTYGAGGEKYGSGGDGGDENDHNPVPGSIKFIDNGNSLLFDDNNILTRNLDEYEMTFKQYLGTGGQHGYDNSKGGGTGGKIESQFYTDIKSYSDYMYYFDDNENINIDMLINDNLVYKYDNGYTSQTTKLGNGGLASYGREASTVPNAYAGRGGFLGIVCYIEKPDDYPNVVPEETN
jgi:hypothetical protein